MKLYLLKPIEPLQDPWEPAYNKAFGFVAFGFVVCAQLKSSARYYAADLCGDEGGQAWLHPDLSSCSILGSVSHNEVNPGVVLRDMRVS